MDSTLSKAANQFAVDLFQCYLKRHGDKYKNLLLCPYLIFHSLAMMLVGAKGNTAQQLHQLLRIPKQMPARQPASPGGSGAASSGRRVQQVCVTRSPSLCSSYSSTGSVSPSLLGPTSSGTSSVGQSRISGRQSRRTRRKSRTDLDNIAQNQATAADTKAPDNNNSSSPRAATTSAPPAPHSNEQSLGKSRVLTPDGADEPRHREFLTLTEQLIHGNHDFVHLASFIYLDKGTKRSERFKNVLRDYYETKPKKIDFDKVELMVKTINEDVARTTENIYSDILSRQEAQKLEKSYMLLVNAVFFRGFWLSNFTDVKRLPFNKGANPAGSSQESNLLNRTSNLKTITSPSATIPTLATEKSVSSSLGQGAQQATNLVNMMSKVDYLPVLSDDQLDARCIMMPFEASDLQMIIILPNSKTSDSTYLCQRISAAKIDSIVERIFKSKSRTVRVSMPIFCIDSGKISLQSTLVEMGASDLFDKKKANMSGVCENKQVWLHKILHRCFIICDNRGAITSSAFEKARRRQAKIENGITTGRGGVEDFVADHPFMYIIIDSVTRTVLLIGLYTDPDETLEVINETQLSPEEAHQIYTEGVYKT